MSTKKIIEDVTGHCLAVRTISAARALTRSYDAALRPVGLTITQFTLLAATAHLKPQSISDLATKLSIERSSLSRNLLPLEKLGLIGRTEEGPARCREISITKAGLKTLKKAYPLWKEVQQETVSNLELGFRDVEKVLSSLRGHELG